MQMHALRHTNICLSLTHGLMHTHIQNTMLLVSSPLQEMMMAFQDSCAEHREQQKRRAVERRMKGEERRRRERWSSWEVSTGSGQEEGPPLKFVSPSMSLEMIAIHPDTMNVGDPCFPFLFSLSLSHTADITQTP